MPLKELDAGTLCRSCRPGSLSFESTDEVESGVETLGQDRANAAIELGLGIHSHGYNLYAMGAEGMGRRHLLRKVLLERARSAPTPEDLCYVENFADPHRPLALRVPAGHGRTLRQDMDQLIEDLVAGLESAFESDEFQTRKKVLEQEGKSRVEEAFETLGKNALEKGLQLLRTPMGMAFAPTRDGEIMPPDEVEKLSAEETAKLKAESAKLEAAVEAIAKQMPRWERELRHALRSLQREVTSGVVRDAIDELRHRHEGLEAVERYIEAVEADVVEQAPAIIAHKKEMEGSEAASALPLGTTPSPVLRRYQVNVAVDNAGLEGAPVIFEDHPTYVNLVGRIEHLSMMGTLTTDFRFIRAGALHRSDGGYLVLEARKLLGEPYAWEALKRCLRTGSLRVESLGQTLGLMPTVALEPEETRHTLKVILVGDRRIYYLLSQFDPEFGELFKVEADFDEQMDWDDDGQARYAGLIATLLKQEGLRAFHVSAVARVLDESARDVGDSRKLSTHVGSLRDLLVEADHFADRRQSARAEAEDVDAALAAREQRAGRIRERMLEQTLRDTLLIETTGSRVGQVNGLSVLSLGRASFGRPSRITARVRPGKGRVVDIEREVDLGGPIHSKGVLILAGFLGARFGHSVPLALHASLVFEQSYGGVDGDSATCAELFALLSAISEIPLRQDLAITGSMSQHGEVQPIGGVNEKIEGFFDLCDQRGLDGTEGVLIPSRNAENLALRSRVVDAVREGRFHIYTMERVDEGLELLTGSPAGERDATGAFPDGSVNHAVEARLLALAETLAAFRGSLEGAAEPER